MKISIYLWTISTCAVFFSSKLVQSVSIDEFIPFGQRHGDSSLKKGDEIATPELRLTTPFVFFDEVFQSLFVNSNGLISFLTEIPYFFNAPFPLDYPAIAPFYSDADTTATGNVFYRETSDREVLEKVKNRIANSFNESEIFHPEKVFVVTWDGVGFYKARGSKTNTYQAVLATNGVDSYVIFHYADGGLQWIKGDGKTSGLEDATGQAGFVASDGRLFTLKGSGTDQVRNLDKWSNVDEPGVWVFKVGSSNNFEGNVQQPGYFKATEENLIDDSSCSSGGTLCHSSAVCNDYDTGFCCQCTQESYGNGISCLNKEKPIRVTGNMRGDINGFTIQDGNIHSYVLPTDGRTYTAISKMPTNLGYDLQSLTGIGEGIAWLFAFPKQGVPNGFDLTGGRFNRTVQIQFPQTGHTVNIKQYFKGLDVFNNVAVDTHISGAVPSVQIGAELEVDAFKEEFTRVKQGQLRSQSSRSFKTKGQSLDTPFTVETFIDFEECGHAPNNPELDTLRFKVDEDIFIRFDEAEKIVRFSFVSKIGPLEEEDPCVQGREECGDNSQCIVDGDSFRCVCEAGYDYIYDPRTSSPICLDVNECNIGRDLCDINAVCVNVPGSYSCQCVSGFSGNGHYCTPELSCANAGCDPNASCQELAGRPQCSCNVGYKGDGLFCAPDFGDDGCDVNRNCSPYAVCVPTSSGYQCQCLQGYVGNGYVCNWGESNQGPFGPTTENPEQRTLYPEVGTNTVDNLPEVVSPDCIQEVCWCPQGYAFDRSTGTCRFSPGGSSTTTDESGNPLPVCSSPTKCTCPPNFLYNPLYGKCDSVSEAPDCNVLNNCHPNAQCLQSGTGDGRSRCVCNAGFDGNGYRCSRSDVSCDQVDICNFYAECVYDDEQMKSVCVCKTGFVGDGMICNPRDDCSSPSDCDPNGQCVYDSLDGRYVCRCNENFKGDGFYCSPVRRETCETLNNCGPDADCVFVRLKNAYECRCKEGFQGDGVVCERSKINCNVINNCGTNAECTYDPNIQGYECKCNQEYVGDGYYCRPDKSCLNEPSICSPDAICQRTSTDEYEHRCVCVSGYVGDGFTCDKSLDHESNLLMINQGLSVLRMPIDKNVGSGHPIHVDPFMTAVGADVDCLKGMFYWTDVGSRTIRSSKYDGSDRKPVIKPGQIGSPEDVAVDWVSNIIFWTDSLKDVVGAADMSGSLVKTVIKDDLVNPRGIAVHPGLGYLFWSDWNRDNPKIERAGMDGTGREILVSGEGISLPNSLVVDFETSTLCWADAGTHKIECIGIQGYGRRTIIEDIKYPFGLTLHLNFFYYTDWNDTLVHEVNKYSGIEEGARSPPRGGSGKLYGIVSVPDYCPPVSNVCQVNRGNCPETHLCLPNGRSGRTCTCPDGSTEECWDTPY